MTMTNRKIVRVLAAVAAITCCKPPGANSSSVASIVGVDGNGQESAFTLLPVRNFVTSRLGASSNDPGVQQATALAGTRLLAIVECASSAQGSAASVLAALEARAAIDDLYVDANRHLGFSSDDNNLAQIGGGPAQLVQVPCHIYGSRLLSWDVLQDIEVRAAGLPGTLPPAGQARDRVTAIYQQSEAIDLAIRSSYTKDPSQSFMPSIPALLDMLAEQAGETGSAATLASRIQKADGIYIPDPCNPANPTTTEIPYAGQLRQGVYSCQQSRPGVFDYRAGGASGSGYAAIRDLVASEIAGDHQSEVFLDDGTNDPSLSALWDLLTGITPWGSATGTRGKIGAMLTSDQADADFAGMFAANAPDARPAAATPQPRQDLTQAAAPFGLGAHVAANSESVWADRRQRILRATAGMTGSRGVLDGGHTSTAAGLPSTASGRTSALGSSMGPAGVQGLQGLNAAAAPIIWSLRGQ
jgi:hypothetical protein